MNEQTEPTKTVVVKKKNSLETKKDGSLDLTPLESKLQLADQLLKQGMISSTFKTPQQVLIGMEYCNALGVKEIVGLRQMYVIKGSPSLYGDGPLMLIQASGELESIKEFFIDENCQEICVSNKNLKASVYGAVTQVKRKGDSEIQEDHFTLDDLEKAQLHIGKYGEKDVWMKFKKNMMRYKARAMAVKSKFADLLNGINISEYNDHFSPDVPEVNNPDAKIIEADSIKNDLIGGEVEKTLKIQDSTTFSKGEKIEDVIETTSEKLFPSTKINVKEEIVIKDPVLAKIEKEMDKTPIKTKQVKDDRPSFSLPKE